MKSTTPEMARFNEALHHVMDVCGVDNKLLVRDSTTITKTGIGLKRGPKPKEPAIRAAANLLKKQSI